MRQGGISEGGGESVGYGDEEEREDDATIGEDGSGTSSCGGVETEVEVANCSCEEGLDCVEEDGEFEEFGGGSGAIGGRC